MRARPRSAAEAALVGRLIDLAVETVALADRSLADGPHCVCEVAAALGARDNNVSNHLARLREAGLVRASRHDANGRYHERDEAAVAKARAAILAVLR